MVRVTGSADSDMIILLTHQQEQQQKIQELESTVTGKDEELGGSVT